MPLVWLINVLLPFDKRFLVDQKVALLILAVKKAAGSLPQSNLSIHQSWGGREGDQSSSGLGGERLWFQLTVYVFFCLSFFFFFFFKHWGVFPLALTGSSISEDVMTCLDFVFNMNFPFFKDFSHYEGCHEDGGRFLVISLIPPNSGVLFSRALGTNESKVLPVCQEWSSLCWNENTQSISPWAAEAVPSMLNGFASLNRNELRGCFRFEMSGRTWHNKQR